MFSDTHYFLMVLYRSNYTVLLSIVMRKVTCRIQKSFEGERERRLDNGKMHNETFFSLTWKEDVEASLPPGTPGVPKVCMGLM